MFKNDTFLAVSALFASTSTANRLGASYGSDRESLSLAQLEARGLLEAEAGLEDYCCTVFDKHDRHVVEKFCLLDPTSKAQSVHSFKKSASRNQEHTYRCGIKADAQICLQGHSLTQEDGNEVYECQGQDVIEVSAQEEIIARV